MNREAKEWEAYLEIAEVLDVIEVLDVLLHTEVPDDIDIAVGALVAGEDVVVRDDDDLLAVPHLGVLPELLEDVDGAKASSNTLWQPARK